MLEAAVFGRVFGRVLGSCALAALLLVGPCEPQRTGACAIVVAVLNFSRNPLIFSVMRDFFSYGLASCWIWMCLLI